jgi:hypothetical protein
MHVLCGPRHRGQHAAGFRDANVHDYEGLQTKKGKSIKSEKLRRISITSRKGVHRTISQLVSDPVWSSLSGVDADFNRGISAYIINDLNRAKNGSRK